MGIEPFDYSATQMLNGSCILGVVIGDSLMRAVHLSALFIIDAGPACELVHLLVLSTI